MSDNPTKRFQQAVVKSLRALAVTAGDNVCVACSYGPDSLALADAVLAVRRVLKLGSVTLVYVDHGLREASSQEGQSVLALAKLNDATGRVVAVTVKRDGHGLEQAAREARYRALDQVADAQGAHWILTGHTASDQAETVLGRLLRGAGPTGLAGIPDRRGRVLRPLLSLTRAEVDGYLAARGLQPALDHTNHDPAFLRNRLRHTLLPTLREENPAVDMALVKVANAMREQADVLDWARAIVDRDLISLTREPSTIETDVAPLADLPAGLFKNWLGHHARLLGLGLEAGHLDAVWALITASESGSSSISVPGGQVVREYQRLRLITGTGQTQPTPPPELRDATFSLRVWRAGDRMRPAHLKGHSKKLQDLFVDLKVPRALRQHARVLERLRDGEILWVEHIGPVAGVSVRLTETGPVVTYA